MMVVDSQIHLWTQQQAPPHHWRTPFLIEDALREMDAAGVDRVVNCPAIWDPASNDYAVEAVRRHPDRFATLGWFPLDGAANEAMVDRWMEKPGMLGLRFVLLTPDTWARVVSGELDWLFGAASRRRLPFGLITPANEVAHLSVIAQAHPGMRMLIDHLDVGPFDKLPAATAHLDALIALARYPNIAVKASAVPSMSNEPYPFADTFGAIKKVYDAFGPKRMFWGTDYTRMRCSWRECVTMFTEELPWLAGDDRELVMGRAVCDWLGWH